MYRLYFKDKLISIMALGALAAVSGLAAPIAVVNPSFENLPLGGLTQACGLGCSYSTGVAIPGWSDTGNSGEFQPGPGSGNTTFFNSVPDPITTAYTNGGTIFQAVVPTVQLGITYTLRVDEGQRKDLAFGSSADLLINGNTIAAVGVVPTPGNWSTFIATYTGLAADVGQAITIQLKGSNGQGNFDNVRLDSNATGGNPTPEPATATVFALGLSGILVYARRRRTC